MDLLAGLPTVAMTPEAKVDAMSRAIPDMVASDGKFAGSMADAFARNGYLSDKQWTWVAKLTERATRKKTNIGCNLDKLMDIFKVAGTHLKRPKIRFDKTPMGHPVALALTGLQSRVPGSVNISDGGKFGKGTWYGRILPDGRFEQSADCTDAIVTFLMEFAQDPAGCAAKYGIATGRCCFCRLTLTDPRSTKVGYGPICAGHFGLPWG